MQFTASKFFLSLRFAHHVIHMQHFLRKGSLRKRYSLNFYEQIDQRKTMDY